MSTLDTQMEEFKREGFVKIPGLLSADQAATYARKLDVLIAEQDSEWGNSPNYIDRGMVHNPMAKDPDFLDVLGSQAVLDPLEAALDPYCVLYAFTTSSMLPHEGNYSTRVHVDCPRIIPNYLTNVGLLIALTPFTTDTGATWFLPRSGQMAEVDEDTFFANAKRPELAPGDAVLFNARTWHCGGQNSTDQTRHALTMNVCRSWMKQRFDYPRLLGPDLLKDRDERLLRFLGYRTRVPVNLSEYYVPADQRLYLSGQG